MGRDCWRVPQRAEDYLYDGSLHETEWRIVRIAA
jgi:hypothetical protein